MDTVAVLGAGGTMGFAMARILARAGIEVRAWNRTREKAEPLKDDSAFIADTSAEAAEGAGIVLTMLTDADAVVTAMECGIGALHVMADSGQPELPIWLQMSTIGEEATEWCTVLAGRYGVQYVDAPVLGTRLSAEQGRLVVLESGPPEARPRVQPVFDAIGHRTIHLGKAGAGTRLKLVADGWALAVAEAGAEAIALAEGLGVDPSLFFLATEGSPLDLRYLRTKGRPAIGRDFTPKLAAKDADLVEEAAFQHGLDLPLLGAVARRLGQAASEHGAASAPDQAA